MPNYKTGAPPHPAIRRKPDGAADPKEASQKPKAGNEKPETKTKKDKISKSKDVLQIQDGSRTKSTERHLMTIAPNHASFIVLRKDAPRVIALCGAPESGKTHVQTILERRYGAASIDDGAIIRRGVMALYNLTWEQVSTQEGKRSKIAIPGGDAFEIRDLLGKLGNHLETLHGDSFIPRTALQEARERFGADRVLSFGSVRRNQASHYARAEHSICIEVVREGAVVTREFDFYDRNCIDIVIENPWRPGDDPEVAEAALEAEIVRKIDVLMRA